MADTTKIRKAVRERYATAAREASGCCGSGPSIKDAISRDLYTEKETAGIPRTALEASLGCGVPTALAELRPGEVVLDLGSGGGVDVLISARRVGPTGKVYGLDMTDEMLELARRNQREAGVENVEFLKGYMEEIPLPDGSVDVVISNCVINLSADKDRVFREVARVLRPGGRVAVSDVLFQGVMPESLRRDLEAWSGCLAGALHEGDYRAKLAAAGFTGIDVEVTRIYDDDALCDLADAPEGATVSAPEHGRFCSAFVRAVKPSAGGS